MSIFEKMEKGGYEQIIFNYDKTTGHRSIIAIHDTTLGPSFGGVRMVDYPNEEAALKDALRLSKAMTYKCAIVGEDCGGSKAVIWNDPKKKNEGQLRAFGRFVQTLKGRFITGVDLNLTLEDANIIYRETPYIVARAKETGSLGPSGRCAALGVLYGMRACAEEVWGSPSLEGKRISVQGLGYVGMFLVPLLLENGAKLTVCDISPEAVENITKKYDVEVVEPDAIYDADVDIFSPNAVGAVLNPETIPRLKCRIVAGAANNQLDDEERDGKALAERGILHAPDYVINAGGVLQAIAEVRGLGEAYAEYRIKAIGPLLSYIFALAKEKGVTPMEAANEYAMARLDVVHNARRIYTGD